MSLDDEYAKAMAQRPGGTVTCADMRQRQIGALAAHLAHVFHAIEQLCETAGQSTLNGHPLAEVIRTKKEDFVRPFLCVAANLPNEDLIIEETAPEEHF